MAVFIPDLPVHLPRSLRRHIVPVLRELDERFYLNSPLINGDWRPDLVLEQRGEDRMVLFSVLDAAYADIFSSRPKAPALNAFLKTANGFLRFLKASPPHGQPAQPVRLVIVMWRTQEKERQLKCLRRKPHIVVCPRSLFVAQGPKVLECMLTSVPRAFYQYQKKTFFPETEIPAASTTRQLDVRGPCIRAPGFFLTYDQERAAKMDLFIERRSKKLAADFRVRLINGVAGSGKTLILITRARMLAAQYPRRAVLFLVHNRPISLDIEYRITAFDGRRRSTNPQISTFWSWCLRQWHASGCNRRGIEAVFDKKRIIDQIPLVAALRLSRNDLYDEFVFIDDYLIDTRQQYLKVQRTGRGSALRAGERRQVWDLYQNLNRNLAARDQVMASRVVKNLCAAPGRGRLTQYDHILIDEAQFFAPSWFELVKKSLTPGAQLFMCADPNQGFLGHRLSWRQAGLGVRGRTKRLQHAYRATRSILKAADYILNACPAEDRTDFLRPDFSAMPEGDKPALIYRDSLQACVELVVNEIAASLKTGRIPPNQILVLYTHTINGFDLARRLTAAAAPYAVHHFANKNHPRLSADAVKLCPLGSATGLEAGVVFILDIESLFYADQRMTLAQEARRVVRETAMRKLYMAMTRAGQKLVLLSTARLPDDIEAFMRLES